MTLKQPGKPDSFVRKYLFPLPVFLTAAFLLYLPVLNHYFVSDDFNVLYRVCLERIIIIPKFFRPLSDVSIYMTYRVGGLNPIWFNSFNILVHGMNGYLLYLLALCFCEGQNKSKTVLFAVLSSAFFICYPFHNEAVVWMLGRGASMACLFALSGWLCYYKIKNDQLRIWTVCSFFFISMTAFESTMIFPFILLLLVYNENQSLRNKRTWVFSLLFTGILHFILRYWLSGSILGPYGKDFFQPGFGLYIINMAKVGGRLILPPSQHAIGLAVLFVLFIILTGYFILKNYKQIRQMTTWSRFVLLSGMLCLACIIPVVTGISTQTSESDRMLYFPSVFVCLTAAYGIVFFLKNSSLKIIFSLFVISYNLFFLELNNLNWRKASSITYSILEKVRGKKINGRTFFLNIPNEVRGAYVFRMGFPDALKLFGKDTTHFIAVNYLPRQDLEKIKTKMTVNGQNAEIRIPPDIILKLDSSGCRQIYVHGFPKITCRTGDMIYYWNFDQLENIQGCAE